MLRIVKDTAKSLHTPSKAEELPISLDDKKLLDEMVQYLKDSQDPILKEKNPKMREGVGLAAPQVGVHKRMLVVYYPKDAEGKEYIQHELVNPVIVVSSIKKAYLQAGEGCLSVDKPHPGNVFRDYRVTVKAYEAKEGKEVEIKAEGFDAIVLQHEIDHLDGKLFYDHIDPNNPFKIVDGAIAI